MSIFVDILTWIRINVCRNYYTNKKLVYNILKISGRIYNIERLKLKEEIVRNSPLKLRVSH